MLKISLTLLSGLFLLACAGNPPPVPPPLRVAAENANRQAIAAQQSGRWEGAEAAWKDALTAYQAIDDWTGQGRSRLGLAQTYARLGRNELAQEMIREMAQQNLFPLSLRARAAYQHALLLVEKDPKQAEQKLELARSLCIERCELAAPLDNLAARIAAGRGEWNAVRLLAQRALDQAKEQAVERAHARRLLVEAALFNQQLTQARSYLALSIEDDQQLAEPEWLLEDYRLLERVARESADSRLAQEARLRQLTICTAIDPTKCPE